MDESDDATDKYISRSTSLHTLCALLLLFLYLSSLPDNSPNNNVTGNSVKPHLSFLTNRQQGSWKILQILWVMSNFEIQFYSMPRNSFLFFKKETYPSFPSFCCCCLFDFRFRQLGAKVDWVENEFVVDSQWSSAGCKRIVVSAFQ